MHPEIDITAADWAIGFVRHYARRTMEAVERHVADTETEAHLKRLKEIVRAADSAVREAILDGQTEISTNHLAAMLRDRKAFRNRFYSVS